MEDKLNSAFLERLVAGKASLSPVPTWLCSTLSFVLSVKH